MIVPYAEPLKVKLMVNLCELPYETLSWLLDPLTLSADIHDTSVIIHTPCTISNNWLITCLLWFYGLFTCGALVILCLFCVVCFLYT